MTYQKTKMYNFFPSSLSIPHLPSLYPLLLFSYSSVSQSLISPPKSHVLVHYTKATKNYINPRPGLYHNMSETNSKNGHYDVAVIGAGVVGPAIATALARQGRSVVIIERDWGKPDRIVGELLQPAGVKALRELGMVQALNNIEAVDIVGYYIKFHEKEILLDYPLKSDALVTNAIKPVPDCVAGDNDKLLTDTTLDSAAWDADERVRGVAFHHGEFLGNLRSIVKAEPNVTAIEGTVTSILRDGETVTGVRVKKNGTTETKDYHATITISCDGIYSKFRKELSPTNVPTIGSYFVGLHMPNAHLPAEGRGHVVLGDHAPVLLYRISPDETRVLCAFRSTKPPSQNDIYRYMTEEVLPALPELLKPAFAALVETRKFRVMPNQYLPALAQGKIPGLVVLGDSLNIRHPLTGGGMTVGLNDAVLLAKLLDPRYVPELENHALVAQKLKTFHRKRKNLDGVINTLSIALYTLFAADRRALQVLQLGCFKYFMRGGLCVLGPIGLLLGMLPFPMLLFNHFFSVAIYAIWCNFVERGVVGFPIALYEAFDTFFTAVMIFAPYLWHEVIA